MNNLNKFDLDVAKYTNLELKEILGLSNVEESVEIDEHIKIMQDQTLRDINLNFSDRQRIADFLLCAKKKLIEQDKITMQIPDNLDVTYGANTNYLIPNTPEANPLIQNPNTLSSSKAVINEGRGGYYPPGYINPINIKTIRRTVNLDSRFRSAYYSTKSSNFHFDLPETFRRVVNMQLDAFEIPLSLWSIGPCNNCLTISGEKVAAIIDLSYGNYTTPFSSQIFKDTSANIVTAMNKALEAKGLHTDISYGVDFISGRSIFSSFRSKNWVFNFTQDCSGIDDPDTPLPLKLGWSLGFRYGTYNLSSRPPDPVGKLYSEGIVNMDTTKYIYISVNDFTNAANNSFVAAFAESTLSKDIIARVQYQGLIQKDGLYNFGDDDDTLNATRSYYGPVDIKKLHLQVLDEYGQVVDFNNMDWSCTLSFDILYD